MTRYVVLLRGINVGGAKRISMADLRELLTGLGCADVRTHLQSGNAVLTSAEKPARLVEAIERRIEADLKMSVSVLVRTAAEMRAIVEANPLPDIATDGSKYVVLFLSKPLDPAMVATLDPAAYAPELFRVAEHEVYLWHPDGIRDAKMSRINWDRKFGVVASARNWRTVTKLADMAAE